MNLSCWLSKTANSAQVIAILAGRSPSGVENAYAADVVSSNNNPRKTNTLVKTPGLSVAALVPKASKAARTMRKQVQPW